jgi:hypothetical protein
MPDVNFRAVMEAEGVTLEQLPDKTKRKIAEYDKTVKHPFSYKKGTEELNPKSKEKLDDLNDDIIVSIMEVSEKEDTPPQKTSEELEAERLAAEEAANKAKEEQSEKDRKKAAKEAERERIKKKNKHFTSMLWGEEEEPGDDD